MRVEDFSGGILDYWVAKALNKEVRLQDIVSAYPPDRDYIAAILPPLEFEEEWPTPFLPSFNWETGGPLIEEYCMYVEWDNDGKWVASVKDLWKSTSGSTALEAVCRAIVYYEFGKEVDNES